MVINNDHGTHLRCNRCRSQLHVGSKRTAFNVRLPTGWLKLGPDEHLCPLCSTASRPRFAIRSTF